MKRKIKIKNMVCLGKKKKKRMTEGKIWSPEEEIKKKDEEGELILAPMVRASTLAFRMLCRSYGAKTAYTPAIIDLKLVEEGSGLSMKHVPLPAYGPSAEALELFCAKDLTPVLTTMRGASRCPFCEYGRELRDMIDDSGEPQAQRSRKQDTDCDSSSSCFSDESSGIIERTCCCGGKGDNPVVVQLGSACPETAVRASEIVAEWADGIDLNMGCAMQFTSQGGMGAELMKQPDKAREILDALVRRYSPDGRIKISCKTRLKHAENAAETVDFLRTAVLPAGCRIVALHARTPAENNPKKNACHWDTLGKIRSMLDADVSSGSLHIIANGGVKNHADIAEIRRITHCDDVMIGTAAIQNASIFSRIPFNYQDVARDLFRTSVLVHNPAGLTKYVTMQMVLAQPKSQKTPELVRDVTNSRSHAELAKVWGLEKFYEKNNIDDTDK